MKSMTGYAYEEMNNEDLSLSVEIKSYNARFLDLAVNMPSFLSRLEKIRNYHNFNSGFGDFDSYRFIENAEAE